MTNRHRFLAACRCQPVDRPPVWLMRQAGRALPEYRALKQKHSFLKLVQTPELAAEITLQPVRRFGFDAAILFSDILVVPEAMGQPYRFRETGGVAMDFAVRSKSDIARLSVEHICERLSYADRALRMLRKELGGQTALIGFSGSPWTLATFMMEGASVPKYSRALALFQGDRKTYFALAEKLTAAVTTYLKMQIAAGVDALQIFDSHGGHLAPEEFQEASGRWMKDIVAAVAESCSSSSLVLETKIGTVENEDEGRGRDAVSGAQHLVSSTQQAAPAPATIVFSLGTHANWPDLVATGASVIGIDWRFPLAEARKLIPEGVALQGNLAPSLLSDATPAVVARETQSVLETMRGRLGHIFNLGHGVPPSAKLENIAALVNTVRSFT